MYVVTDEIPGVYLRISDAINKSVDPGEFVTQWVSIVEIIDADGDKGLYVFDSEDCAPWDALGLLEFALQKARAKLDMATWYSHSVGNDEDENENDDD